MFWLIIATMFFGNAAWWFWADRHLRTLTGRVLWRTLLGAFVGGQLAYLLVFIVSPTWGRQSHQDLPEWWLGLFYFWSLIILPITLVAMGTIAVAIWTAGRVRRDGSTAADSPPRTPEATAPLSRRQLLTAAAVAVPPLIAGAGVAYGRWSLYDLRVRSVDVPVPNLPPDLDGLTIAQITDVHTGKFVDGPYLRSVRELSNGLHADLHLMTGDLIDLSIADLPVALDFVEGLDPKHGLVMCEGNHDLIDSAAAFYRGCRSRSIPLVVNNSQALRIPGRSTPVRVLGLPWNMRGPGPEAGHGPTPPTGDQSTPSVRRLAGEIVPGEFSVLLAHHPHAFDAAAAAGIPLTLAGHTHGGLLMLTETIGPGPLLYRYWSGLYRKNKSHLFVANGVGTWFPVRTNARPEIAHLTLRRA